MTRTALYPGVFAPPTLGHLDIITRSLAVCDKLIVGIAENSSKTTPYSIQEREAMLKAATRHLPFVEIAPFSGLVIDFAKKRKVQFLLRGLRTIADFEKEWQMAATNRQMCGIETLFIMGQYPHISSSLIREIAHLGGPLKGLVPTEVVPFLRKKARRRDS